MGQEGEHRKGYVYILANQAFPRLVKVGRTTKDPEARARELSSGSGVPAPFTVEWSALVNDCHGAERCIHQQLDDARARRDREFFEIPLHEAISIASRVAAQFPCEAPKPASGMRFPLVFAAILIVGLVVWLGGLRRERRQDPQDDLRPGPPPAQWRIDPTPLLIGQAATVILRDGSTQTGLLLSADTDHVLLTIGSETHTYKAPEIAQVIQHKPANLEASEKQACLTQIEVTFRHRASANQGQKLVTVTVANKSNYDFKGRVRLRSYDRDEGTTGDAEVDLAEGQGLRAGQSATIDVIFQTSRWVSKVTPSADGEFYRRVADVIPTSGSTRSRPASR